MRHLKGNRFSWIIGLSWLLGLIFIYAGAVKIGDPQAFADSISTFQLFPDGAVSLLALGLPPFEFIVGTMLLMRCHPRPTSLAVLILGIVFAITIGQAIARGLTIDCGCFGKQSFLGSNKWSDLARDVVVIAAGGLLYQKERLTNVASK